jgi:O-6-methylguanine DNA methyltransferase
MVFQLIIEDFPQAIGETSFFGDLIQRLKRYVEGELVSFDDELDLASATPFRRAVWQATRSIPYGETRSYSWVAQHIRKPRALRAVGQALAHNPIPIVVPCHRVVNKNGNLGGFGGGLEMKKRLLKIEALHSESN